MPIYEYRCDSCEHEFEQFLRGGDDDPDECPECRESTVSRLISDTSFQLKGSGWYETDYARDDEPDGESEPDGEATESATEAEETSADGNETDVGADG